MSSTEQPPAPQPSALPPQISDDHATSTTPEPEVLDAGHIVKPLRKPLLRLEIRDLSSSGSHTFLRLIHAATALQSAVDIVLTHLYTGLKKPCIPPTRSITLVLRAMDGVAYTTGLDLDDDHKEIHLSTAYIAAVNPARQKEEIQGVLIHEMVHCWQHSGFGTAPGGLTEGVADWVRLKAGFAPAHWKRHTDCEWDAGYERTGYFLEWLEGEFGMDVVRRINDAMRGCEYDAEKVWQGCCGRSVEELWGQYKNSVENGDCEEKEKQEHDEGRQKNQEDVEDETQKTAGNFTDVNDESSQKEDDRAIRQKVRRGGNMHVPVRPGTSS